MRTLLPILLLLAAISAVAQISEPETASARGLRGRVRSVRIYDVVIDTVAGAGPLRRMRLAERLLFDGKGREIEHLRVPDSGIATIVTYDYDPSSQLAARRIVPVIVGNGETFPPSTERSDASIEHFQRRLDRTGAPVEQIVRDDNGGVIARTVYLRDRAGELLADSSFVAGALVRLRSYLRDVQRGTVRTTFTPASSGAPTLTMMEELSPEGMLERRIEFRGDSTIDVRYDAGRVVAWSIAAGGNVEERCVDYENDRHGNWTHAWSWRRVEEEGAIGWRPIGESIMRAQE